MKKEHIKRRKRVMPALNSGPNTAHESSASPDPAGTGAPDQATPASSEYTPNQQLNLPHHERPMNGVPNHVERLLEPPTQSYGPPPVDFTSYSTSSRSHEKLPTTTFPLYPGDPALRTNRKRTLSEAQQMPLQATSHDERSNATGSVSSDNQGSIDPSLAAYARRAESQVDAMSEESREDRMERLRRERDLMAERVAAMNMELARIEEESG